MNPMYKFGITTRTTNLFRYYDDPDNVLGYAVNTGNGTLYVNSGYNTTGYLDISECSGVMVSALWDSAFYDSNKKYVKGVINTQGKETVVVVPQKAKYIRLSVPVSKWSYSGFFVYAIRQVLPIYKDDLSKEYELETNQRFYRAKLSGKLSFLRNDYNYIDSSPFEATFYLYMWRSDNLGVTWNVDFKGQFFKTDCTFNVDDQKITVQIDPLDEYNEVLAGLEKEYNLITLKPVIERLQIQKRPLIQTYIPGDSIVSCFLGGTFWEQDAEATTDRNRLVRDFHFALCNMLKEMNVTVNGTPTAINGLYAGRMVLERNTNNFTGKLYPDTNTGYYIYCSMAYSPPFFSSVLCQIKRVSDDVVVFEYNTSIVGSVWDNLDFTMNAKNGATGTARVEMATYNIYARYLLDVMTISGLNTYDIPGDDIVGYNRNYRRAIGYAIDIAEISNDFSVEPTEWGRADNGKYFLPPYNWGGQKYYPIARSTWRYASIWFRFAYGDEWIEKEGRKPYVLRDAFPVSSVISVLLKQIAPGIKHEPTAEYSQFLYGEQNPISYQRFKLLVTQKSNILVGDYQQPAQKAPTTLQQFTNMLRDCYKCFWYIENGKFKIEHVSWFQNGGSYNYNQIIGYDLTKLENIRNGKKWAFSTSEYSFDKMDLAERFQFGWMDDVTLAFEGLPIEIKSKYISPGKIEEINLSYFTSDVDMMLLNPGNMSNDGFALFAAVTTNAFSFDPSEIYPGVRITSGTNELTTPTYGIRSDVRGVAALLNVNAYGGGTARVVFYKNGAVISTQGTFVANNTTQKIAVNIPNDADALGLMATGEVTAYLYKLEVPTQYELPFVERMVDGVTYYLQNGYLAFINLQPTFYTYDLPARDVLINGSYVHVNGIERKKKQTLSFPVENDPNPMQLIKTYLGIGQIDKISINLCSLMTKTTLKYDTE